MGGDAVLIWGDSCECVCFLGYQRPFKVNYMSSLSFTAEVPVHLLLYYLPSRS
jgi:hypothetical protein